MLQPYGVSRRWLVVKRRIVCYNIDAGARQELSYLVKPAPPECFPAAYSVGRMKLHLIRKALVGVVRGAEHEAWMSDVRAAAVEAGKHREQFAKILPVLRDRIR